MNANDCPGDGVFFLFFGRVTSDLSFVKLRGRKGGIDSSQLHVSTICNKNNHSRHAQCFHFEWTKGGIRMARTPKERSTFVKHQQQEISTGSFSQHPFPAFIRYFWAQSIERTLMSVPCVHIHIVKL